ncbi:hypothetical protein [Rubritalea tangerina]
MKSPVAAEYDEYDHDLLFFTIEKIVALANHGLINSAPPSHKIEPLIAPFMKHWTEYHQSAGHDIPVERKAVIEHSFVELLVVAKNACSGSFGHRISLISAKMNQQ